MLDRRGFLALGGVAGLAVFGRAGLVNALGGPDWKALARSITGTVVLPEDPAYGAAHETYIARFDSILPQAVVQCASAQDVPEVIRFAQRYRIPVAPRCGGHSFAGYSTGHGIVLDVSRINQVTATGGTAVVGAGAKLVDVHANLLRAGVTIPSGTCPTVGVSGLTIGGGYGMAGRRYGLAADRLTAVDLVLADGSAITCDAGHHPDLFWALRGGGGNFGVVTQFRFDPIPAEDVIVFRLTWPWSSAAQVLAAWQSWAPAAPDELTSSLAIDAFAPGDPAMSVSGQWFGSRADLETELAGLAAPTPSTVDIIPGDYEAAVMYWAGCTGISVSQCHLPGQTPDGTLQRFQYAFTKSDFFDRPLPAEGVAALLAKLTEDRTPEQIRAFSFNAFGGAYNRVAPNATAFVHRDTEFLLQYEAQVPMTATGPRQAVHDWISSAWSAMRPWASGFAYQNYIDADLSDWRTAYYGANYPWLARIKDRYDPDRFFDFAQAV